MPWSHKKDIKITKFQSAIFFPVSVFFWNKDICVFFSSVMYRILGKLAFISGNKLQVMFKI